MFLEQYFANQFLIALATVSSQSNNTWKSVKSINWAPARHRVILHQKYYLFEKEMQNSWTLWNREKIHIFVQWSYSSNIYNWGGISWFYTYGQNICNFKKVSMAYNNKNIEIATIFSLTWLLWGFVVEICAIFCCSHLQIMWVAITIWSQCGWVWCLAINVGASGKGLWVGARG